MQQVIVISAALLAVLFLIPYLLQRRGIAKVNEQLADIAQHPTHHIHVKLPLPGYELEQLVVGINKQLDQHREEQVKHQSRERMIKQEIANISHDLRTPLTSMQGYASLLKDPSVPEGERQEVLEIILHKMAVMNNMVESFYELSSLGSGDYPLELQPVYLYSLLSEVILAFYSDLEQKNIDVQLNLDEAVRTLNLDEKATIRIFSNVIQNVLRYAKSRLTISLLEQDHQVQIIFTNDTHHIHAQDLPKLFERTYTADPSRANGQLGLGLSIVKQLVEKQKGSIEASLAEGEFRLVIRFG
ncbi:HAMP domain-containing histidine kinase [Paenibacillus albidus]|uniref:sensor histidine kinase n=1 Tax=Paenibacillus albidus TaxID=2041023 RepID=UPI001BED2062|nr:HAMP domain-containing sensor histidine kinase [Paenibacillus albidus]MBT2292810.1 HAMP domain-containing histidine kinase [Paenibacillus albidus]